MREIIFRGKRTDNGEWVQGYLVKGRRAYIVTFYASAYMVVSPSCHASVDFVVVDTETVGQFTGLTDKNGTKIFEGDIVKFLDGYKSNTSDYDLYDSIGKVDWDEEVMCFYFTQRYSVEMEDFDIENGCMTEVEVIGNVFDNPELVMG